MKLCQVNALCMGHKGEVTRVVTDIYKVVQKPALFTGHNKTYRPYDEVNGEKLPSETMKVQYTTKSVIESAKEKWSDLWDLTCTQDKGNQTANADIVVDGVVVMANVPVTSLLFLDKQVNDVETFVSKLPTPDPSEDWTYDSNLGMLKSEPRESIRAKKEPSSFVKADATKEHPAQVEFFYKDTPVGTWTTINFSGAIGADEKEKLLVRIKKLKDAIKLAREAANYTEVQKIKAGEPLIGFIFG